MYGVALIVAGVGLDFAEDYFFRRDLVDAIYPFFVFQPIPATFDFSLKLESVYIIIFGTCRLGLRFLGSRSRFPNQAPYCLWCKYLPGNS